MRTLPFLLLIPLLHCSFATVHGKNDLEKPKRNLVLEKIQRIEIPGVNFFETPLSEVMATLTSYTRANDSTEPDPAAKGVNIIVLNTDGAHPPQVTIQLNKMNLEKMLAFITEMVGWTYEVRDDAIVVSKDGGEQANVRGLETQFFDLTQGTIRRMAGDSAVNSGGAQDPFAPRTATSPIDNQAEGLKQHLIGSGVEFDERKGHKFIFDGFQMIVTHEQDTLDRIRGILLEFDSDASQQVGVDIKILETPLGALDEILDDLVGDDFVKRIHLESSVADQAFKALRKEEEVDFKALPRLVVMDGQPGSTRTVEEIIYPTDYQPTPTPGDGNGSSARVGPVFDTVAPDDEQPGFREVGTKVDLTPRIESRYGRISIEMAPKITELIGYEEYGNGVKMPKFWTWKVNTSVTLRKNHTMIFRGSAMNPKREIIFFIRAEAFH